MMLETYMNLCMTGKFSGIKSFAPKVGKMKQKGPKTTFLNYLKNFPINFYGICYVMKNYIFFAVFLFLCS